MAGWVRTVFQNIPGLIDIKSLEHCKAIGQGLKGENESFVNVNKTIRVTNMGKFYILIPEPLAQGPSTLFSPCYSAMCTPRSGRAGDQTGPPQSF